MTPRPSLLRGTPTCASRSSCARSARAPSPGWTPRSPSTPPGSSSPRWTPSTTRRCRLHGVTASGRVPHSRSSATMPDLAEVLAARLAHLRLLGRSERTVYDRERAVIRLAAWLREYDDRSRPVKGSVVQQDDQQAQDAACTREPALREPSATAVWGVENGDSPPLLAATAADLAAWRASLTVGDQAVVVYCAHVAGFYDFAVTRGIRPDNPAAGRPRPPPPRGGRSEEHTAELQSPDQLVFRPLL